MFAETNVQLLEPNVLYLDEKPPKIVKQAKRSKKMVKKKIRIEKTIKSRRQSKRSQGGGSGVSGNKVTIIKKEGSQTSASEAVTRGQIEESAGGADDPLYTSASDKAIKMEVGAEEEEQYCNKKDTKIFEAEFKTSDNETAGIEDDYSLEAEEMCLTKVENVYDEKVEKDEVEDNREEEYDEDDDNDEDYFKDSGEENEDEVDYEEEEDDEDDEDDEPLIMIAQRKGRPSRKGKVPRPERCRDVCKQKCGQKFTEEQRRSVCSLFWSLSNEEKKLYIRQHTRIKRKRYERVKRRNSKNNNQHFAYFLDDDTAEDGKKFIKVCRRYFESTLNTTNYIIKKALDGYEPELEDIIRPPSKSTANDSVEKKETSEDPEQFLDPETGNLITIDPNAEKMKNTTSSAVKPKVKRKRGDPPPVHNPKPVKCEQRCIFKCHTKFTEEDRKQICDIFWSLDYNRRKDFILARIETKDIEVQTTPEFRKSSRPPRAYHTRFFLRSASQGENVRVCKHFMMNTLSISRMFITNAIDFADKTTGHYTGLDRRGLNAAANKIAPDRLQFIKDHIGSYPTWIPYKKSKTRYLHHSLSIKRMYLEYKQMCIADGNKFVSTNIYYKSFHDDFRLSFLSNPGPSRGGGFLKSNPNVSHYTGEEAGGIWLDPKGEKLDLSLYDPAQSFMSLQRSSSSSSLQQQQQQPTPLVTVGPMATPPDNSTIITEQQQTALTATTSSISPSSSSTIPFHQTTFSYTHLIDPSVNPGLICQTPSGQHEFNLSLYDTTNNVPHAHAASTSSLFRRL